MDKEKLKKEAIKYAVDYPTSYGKGYKHKDLRIAYLAGAEPREKRIAKLEKEISNLLSCKDCPDNHGGYICDKEYNDKCLSQKIQYIKELKEEITTLEKENAKLRADHEVLSCSVGDFGELQDKFEEEQRKNNGLSDNLTKAKEIIKKVIEWAEWQGSGCPKFSDITAEAEQFIKE